jgi:hypothetical protein
MRLVGIRKAPPARGASACDGNRSILGSVAALERDRSSRGEHMTDQNRDMGNDQKPEDGMGQGPDDMSHGMGRDSGQGTGQGGATGEGSLKGAISGTRDSHGQPDMTGPEGNRSWQSVDSDDDTRPTRASKSSRPPDRRIQHD